MLFPKALVEGPTAYAFYEKEAKRTVSLSFFRESYDFAVGLMTAHIAECLNGEGGYSQLTSQTVGAISQSYKELDSTYLSRSRYGVMLSDMIAARGGIGLEWIGGVAEEQ